MKDGSDEWEGTAAAAVAAGGEEAPAVPCAGEAPPAGAWNEDAGGLGRRIEALEAAMTEVRDDLLEAFAEKRAEDRFREEQVDRLHTELQDYKNDLLARVTRPLVLGMIRLHDELGRGAEELARRGEALAAVQAVTLLRGFRDDVEIELGRIGIAPFTVEGDGFDPHRQSAVHVGRPGDPSRAGRVAERRRPGFVHGETVVRREQVVVYGAAPAAADPSTPSGEETSP